MSQYDFSTIDADTKSGAALAADLNAWRDALHQMHSGGTAPSYAVKGTVWLDDSASPWVIKFYDGVTWITVFQIDEVANEVVATWIKPDGTEAMTGELTLSSSTPSGALIAASKGYVDTQIAAVVVADDAVEVAYDNATSGLTATDVQAALDEINGAKITQAAGDTRYLNESSNLSDLPNAATARTNLGLGTAAVVNTGTGAGDVPTNAQAVLPTPGFTSSDIAIGTDGSFATSEAHGLGSQPKDWELFIKCTGAEAGYAVGNEIKMTSQLSSVLGPAVSADATNMYLASDAILLRLPHRSTGANTTMAEAGDVVTNFVYVIKAWK